MRALRRLVRQAAGAVGTDVEHVAVAVEQVVDDLEERAELGGERAPRLALGLRHLGRGERAADGCREERSCLQPVQVVAIALAAQVEPLAADHVQRRPDELARDLGRRVGEREPERLGEQRVAGEDRLASPNAAQTDGSPRRSRSSSSAGRSSWTSENEWTSSTAAAAGNRFSTARRARRRSRGTRTGRTRLPPIA